MEEHQFIADPAVSISRGPPLADEAGLGELTLAGFIRQVTSRFPEREALMQCLPDGSAERWSYRALWQRSLAVAKALVANGLGKNERVGVLMTNRPEFLAAVFGTALAGGVATPLSTFSTASELEQLLSAAACPILIYEHNVLKRDFSKMLGEIEPAFLAPDGELASTRLPFLRRLVVVGGVTAGRAIQTWEVFLRGGETVSDDWVKARAAMITPADPGVLFFSSGSTGKPKGILSAHRGVTIQMWRMARQQGMTDDVRYWTANGFFWSGNFAMAVGATLAAGGTLVLQRTFEPVEALELMAAERVTFLFAWPHQWAQLVEAPNWDSVNLSALKYIDAECPIARHPTVRSTWLQPTYCYGNTETFTLSTAYPANTSREEAAGSHGRPLPGNSVKIVDPLSGRLLPLGTHGEIAVKGPTLMLGFLGVPLDETLDDEGYFATGDGGYLDVEGRLFWEGRLNDIIKTGGANVSPVEIDEHLATHPDVKLAKTVGVPHDTLGEIVVACIVLHEAAVLGEEQIRAFAREALASYKVPRRVLFFTEEELQLTGSAKIKTSDLRALAVARLGTS